jgi:hypothetical protein
MHSYTFAIEVLHLRKSRLAENQQMKRKKEEQQGRAMQAKGQTKGGKGGRVVVTHV